MKDVGVFREEAEYKPGHEMIHVRPPLDRAPLRVVLEQFQVELVEAVSSVNIKAIFTHLPNGADARQRQKEAKFIVKVGIFASNGFARFEIFCLEGIAVRGQGELRPSLTSRRADL